MKQKSLFGQILLWMMIPLTVLWPLSFLVSYNLGRNIADAPFDQGLKNSVLNLSQQLQSSYSERSLSSWGLSVPSSDEQDHVYYQVAAVDAETIVGTVLMPEPPSEMVLNRVQLYDAVMYDEPVRVAYMWVDLTGQSLLNTRFKEHPIVLIQVAESSRKRESLARQILQGVTLPQLIFLPIAVMLIWFGLSRGVLRLNQLQYQMSQRDSQDLSDLSTEDTPEELQPLVHGFNHVLSRLRRHIVLQKRFLTNTAHQIKTPLAGLKTHAEYALATEDEADRKHSLKQIVASSERTARLVNQLIALSRTEHLAEERLDLSPVDLTHIAREQTIYAADRALQKGLHIALEVPEKAVWVSAHAIMLGELIKNLVDNAIFYTSSLVVVRVTFDEERAHLYVLDDGPGIAPEERDSVFEPFHSILGASGNGSGLGLAIVRQIAQMHHGLIEVRDNDELECDSVGTVFHVSFPRKILRSDEQVKSRLVE